MRSRMFLCIVLAAVCALGAAPDSPPAPPSPAPQAPPAAPEKPPVPMSAQELDALLSRVEREFGTIESLKTTFVQEKRLAIFTDIVKSEGITVFARPNRVRIEITQPYQSVLIANGKAIARYENVNARWTKLDSGSPDAVLMVTNQIAAWLAGRFRDKDSIYELSATKGESATLTLSPKSEKMRSFITAIELEIPADFSQIKAITLREPGGDFTKMFFADPRRNVTIPDAVFDTSLPAPAPWVEPPASEQEKKSAETPADGAAEKPHAP